MSDSMTPNASKSDDAGPRADANLLQRSWMFWRKVLRRFQSKGGMMHASSLSYTSLVGMIPVLAVGLSVATSLIVKDGEEGQEQVEAWIESMIKTVAPMLDLEFREDVSSNVPLPPEPDEERDGSLFRLGKFLENVPSFESVKVSEQGNQRKEVARRIANYVDRIHTKTIGFTSVCLFLVVAIMMLRAIERTFNQIWDVPKHRTWGAGVAQYWAGLTLGPFLLVLGTTLSSRFLEFGRLGKVVLFLLAWMFTGAACALVYRIMTNTRMTFKAATCGGLTAGLLLQLNSQLPVIYFSNVATSNKIYGSLGAIPILLLGLYISWIIVIFGSHVAFMVQCPKQGDLSEEPSAETMLEHSTLTAVRVMQSIAERFQSGSRPYTSEELAEQLQLEHSKVADLVEMLVESGLIFRGEASLPCLSLGKPADKITVKDIFKVVEKDLDADSKIEPEDVCVDVHRKIIHDRDRSAAAVKLSDLVNAR